MAKLTYIFDIDGTICTDSDGNYDQCRPLYERISQINRLFEQGNTIIYCTARGMGSSSGDQKAASEKYFDYTENQLNKWGCLYHRLYLGKPKGDIYVDDKAKNASSFF